jgi:sugar lactone lactonase YvrE
VQGRLNVRPAWALPGGALVLDGDDLPLGTQGPPYVEIGHEPAHVLAASRHRLVVQVPSGPDGGALVRVEGVRGEAHVGIARPLVSGIHQVDSPAFDGLGRLYVTQSGSRGTKAPVSIFRVAKDGTREPVAVEVANPTSLALGPDGAMYVSSRFEGNVYRLTHDDRVEAYATELGVPTGLAFDRDGALFVGDRSGSVFRVGPDRRVETFASLPASVAAFHLTIGPDGSLYVTAPTLASHDVLYRVTPDRLVEVVSDGFGRPQGLAFDKRGDLYVADALAGAAGLYRVDVTRPGEPPVLVLAAPTLVGVAFDSAGGVVLASNDTVWRLETDFAEAR